MTGTIPGDVLRAALERAGMTQADLGRKVPVSEGRVSRWIHNSPPVSGPNALRVRTILAERGVELPRPSCRLFLATPMAALSADEYEQDRAATTALFDTLTAMAGPVYWPGRVIELPDRFEAPDLATERNLRALAEAEALVYYQGRDLGRPSSALVELGMALQRRIPVTVFAPSEDSLPFMLRRFDSAAARLGLGRYRFHEASEALRLLGVHGAELLGLPVRAAA